MAISELDLTPQKSTKIKKENIDSDDAEKAKLCKLNTRSIMNSHNFMTIMAITTLVPFIKTGIPRLSDFDVKEAKAFEKDNKKKNKSVLYTVKPFVDNFDTRTEIIRIINANEIKEEDVFFEKGSAELNIK